MPRKRATTRGSEKSVLLLVRRPSSRSADIYIFLFFSPLASHADLCARSLAVRRQTAETTTGLTVQHPIADNQPGLALAAAAGGPNLTSSSTGPSARPRWRSQARASPTHGRACRRGQGAQKGKKEGRRTAKRRQTKTNGRGQCDSTHEWFTARKKKTHTAGIE